MNKINILLMAILILNLTNVAYADCFLPDEMEIGYDRARAIKLSYNRKNKKREISFYKPAEFFATKIGVYVGLARFGVEALNKIDPNNDHKKEEETKISE